MDVLIDYAKGEFRIDKYAMMDEKAIEDEVKKIIDKNPGLEFKQLMGMVMGKLRGKASGKQIAEIVKKYSS